MQLIQRKMLDLKKCQQYSTKDTPEETVAYITTLEDNIFYTFLVGCLVSVCLFIGLIYNTAMIKSNHALIMELRNTPAVIQIERKVVADNEDQRHQET
jgi:hypothetical protein